MQKGPSNVVFIAGMGPAGLTAAIGAAQKGYQVVIADPRTEMTRGQRVQIDQNPTITFLESLRDPTNAQDAIFFNHKISRNGETTVEIKDLQRYLLRKLDLMSKNANHQIRLLQNHSVVGIDPYNLKVTLKNESDQQEQTIDFNHFIEADGANHPAANLLNARSEDRFKIQYKDVDYQPRQIESGTITLQVKAGHQLPKKRRNAKTFEMKDMERLKKYGWNQPYFPKVYIFSNNENTKLFISGEVPKSIYNLTDDKKKQREALVAWGKVMANILYEYEPQALTLVEKSSKRKPKKCEAKNKIKTTAFPLKLKHADKPCLPLCHGGSYILVGDANKNANFFFSHGANDAIKDSLNAVMNLSDSQSIFNFTGFTEYQVKQYSGYVDKLKLENEPTDMRTVKSDILKHIDDAAKIAKSISAKKFDAQTRYLQTSPDVNNPDQMQSFYKDLDLILNEMSLYLTAQMKNSSSPFCGMFGKNYPKLAHDLSVLKTDLSRDFRRYFNLNPNQAPLRPVFEFRSLECSATGSVTIVPSPMSSAVSSARLQSSSNSPCSSGGNRRLPDITGGYTRLIEPIEQKPFLSSSSKLRS